MTLRSKVDQRELRESREGEERTRSSYVTLLNVRFDPKMKSRFCQILCVLTDLLSSLGI
jgi:hypothetical protein